jgi:benzoyl-CoA reductase/2-hydroxyglutaryl-CoA dehydratase subunit BcrC/BadD/HgdB
MGLANVYVRWYKYIEGGKTVNDNIKESVWVPDALKTIREMNAEFPKNRYAAHWRAEGGKIVGWVCNYVPEELLHAAGILPVRVMGYQDFRNINDGTIRLSTSICSFTRSCMQILVDGEADILDGFIGGTCCDGTRRFSESVVLEGFQNFKLNMINPPFRLAPSAVSLYAKELRDAVKWIESSFNVTITDDALENSIRLHNETRRLFRKLNEMRKKDQPPVLGSEFMEITNASFVMPKEEFNKLLRQLLKELEERGRVVSGEYRVLISGTPMTNPEFFRAVESYGGLIVTEEMCTGARYYWELVDEGTKNPIDALASRYLANYPCARMIPADDRLDKLEMVAKEWRVDAVISTIIRFCALYGTDLLMLKERLQKKNLPLLELSVEYNEGATEQNKTRIQAFGEMLRAKKIKHSCKT